MIYDLILDAIAANLKPTETRFEVYTGWYVWQRWSINSVIRKMLH